MRKWMIILGVTMAAFITGCSTNEVGAKEPAVTETPAETPIETPVVVETPSETPQVVVEVIKAEKVENTLEGLNLLQSSEVDFDGDGTVESVELYTSAEIDEKGEIMADDGQEWLLVVHQGDEIYPIIERQYVQLGSLSYSLFEDYDDNNRLHLLAQYQSTAGYELFDCTYDVSQVAFDKEEVFSKTNINTLSSW